jgi:ATP-dependent Clp protease ATP-binding subunit ClpB
VEINLARLNKRLIDRRITVEATPAAKEWLALTGFDPVFGARPLRRLIQTTMEDQLAQRVLAGQVHEGETVTFDADESSDGLTILESQPAIA